MRRTLELKPVDGSFSLKEHIYGVLKTSIMDLDIYGPGTNLRMDERTLAERLAARPALSLRLAKEAVRRSLAAGLDEMLDYELDAQTECFRSADAREGVRAFLEKRPALFGRAPAG